MTRPTKRRNKLTDRPPDGEQGQKAAVCHWEELKEQGTINGQVSTNSETNAGEESARSDPVGCSSCGDTKDTSNAKGAVESKSAADNIRHDTPERGTDAETEEEGEGSVSDCVRVNTVFIRQGRERQCDTLKPEAEVCC